MKIKMVRFILALMASPVYIPLWAVSLLTIFLFEAVAMGGDYQHAWDYHKSGITWYLLR